ncbi:hypothetical protein, partial [Nguyenibacter vanlangensis]
RTRLLFDGGRDRMVELAVHARAEMRPGDAVAGPALIVEQETTTYVPARFDAHIDGGGNIVMDMKETA